MLNSNREDADDHLLVSRSLRKLRVSTDLVWADNLNDGLVHLAKEEFDVVLTDLSLPDSFGLETVERIRNQNQMVPVVVLTTLEDDEVESKTLAAGAQDYLIKDEVTQHALGRVFRHAIQRQASVIETQQLLSEVEMSRALLAEQQLLLKRKNRRLRKLYKTAQRFVDNVSHEFRTPLTVIKDYVSLVRQGMAGKVNDEQGRMLDIAEIRTDELNNMVDDMLDVSKLESGLLSAWRRPCQLSEIVETVCRPLIRKAEVRGIQFEIEVGDSRPLIYCDSEKLGRVIINLVTNAIKFCGEPGHVKLHAYVDAVHDEFVIGVTDNGPGIDAEGVAEIFKRFKQLKTKSKSSTNGFGLGLNIAKELVAINFGEMSVQSQLGQGTTFSFTVPLNRPVRILDRYLSKIGRSKRRQPHVALLDVAIDADAENPSDADAFFNYLLRQNDLLFRIDLHRWIFVLHITESELTEFEAKVERERVKANRNRPFGPLPKFEMKVAGIWNASTDSEAMLKQLDSITQAQPALV